jgi:regulator of protease activity HflC (stomatin/prohibitin superfamily)
MKKLFLMISMLGTLALTGCGGVIDQGNVGVRTTFGRVNTEPVESGVYVAIMSSVKEFTAKESAINFEGLTPKAKDNLSLKDLDMTVYYKTNPGKIPGLTIKYTGLSAQDRGLYFPAFRLIEKLALGVAVDEVSRHDSLIIHTQRNTVAEAIKVSLQKQLDSSDPDTFTITRVVISQLLTDPQIEASILANVQMQKQVEAKNSELELAKAEARRTVAEAQGTAQRNNILTQSITPQLIEYKKALAMENCASSEHCTMIIGNATPIVNTGK